MSIQAQVLNLLNELKHDLDLTYIFVAHDLSVVEYISDRVGVMYLGNFVEVGEKEKIYSNPMHPYTQALLSAVPVPDPTAKRERILLEGSIPSAHKPPTGCKFHTRCPKCMECCKHRRRSGMKWMTDITYIVIFMIKERREQQEMKLFISADIEGCAGVALTDETHKKESVYQRFAEEMTEEVVAACEAAHEAGADEIVVKDGHGDASNIDPLKMPEYVTLIRGKSGHPYNMMYGIDDSYDGVLYLGYHAPAGDPNFSISHTSTGNSLYIHLNGKVMSECMLNSYTAASHHVPVLFLSGDEEICRQAKELIPGITTVETKHGVGAATWCKAKGKVISEIREGVKKAVAGQKKRVSGGSSGALYI